MVSRREKSGLALLCCFDSFRGFLFIEYVRIELLRKSMTLFCV